ncbi:RasGEF domain-domain-containing protein, partial [Absidia repens]
MQSVQAASAFHWTPDVLAKQIAVIDCQLFGMVKLEKSLLCQTDLSQTHLDRMLDFHHYLTNNFAHQLIFWASLSKSSSSAATDTVVPPVHPKDNMISHLVQVAHALLHTYRDLSGFAAIMKALMLPQVRRLRSLWKNCPSRIKEMYGEMVPILSPDHHYQAYHNVLCQKLSYFFFTATSPSSVTTTALGTSTIDRMVVIPWMQPHLISLRSIVTDYAAIGESSSSNIDLVLSAPGLQKLAVVMALLEQCQTCPASSSLATDLVSGKRSRRQSMVPSVNIKSGSNISSSITTISDLHTLFPGDLLVHHWLVSRVYLRKDQLVDESIQVQPLFDGEQLVCDTHSLDDVAIADLVAKNVSIPSNPSGGLLERPSDVPSSPVISATFAGWKTATKSETNAKRTSDEQEKPTLDNSNINKHGKKSKLSPTAPEFVPLLAQPTTHHYENIPSSDDDDDDDEDDEEWTGYPGPPQRRRASLQSVLSDEWKGYEAAKMEATWELETALKVQQQDWQGYALETLNEEEPD